MMLFGEYRALKTIRLIFISFYERCWGARLVLPVAVSIHEVHILGMQSMSFYISQTVLKRLPHLTSH